MSSMCLGNCVSLRASCCPWCLCEGEFFYLRTLPPVLPGTRRVQRPGRGSSRPVWPALQPVRTVWMPLRVGCSAPITLTSCVWRHSAPTRKARALRCQGSDPRTARFLFVLLLCVRNPWPTPLPRSSGLQFLWARRRYRFFSGSSFCLLVSPSLSQNTGLRMDVARVALLPGLCLASRIPFQVCAMLGLTPCAQLDFCRKFFNALAVGGRATALSACTQTVA